LDDGRVNRPPDSATDGSTPGVGRDAGPAELTGLATAVLDEENRRLAARGESRRTADDADRAEAAELTSAHPAMTLRQGLRAGGAATFIVLVLLNSFDELEGAALAVLAPDIASTFHISDGMIVFLSAAAGAFIVLGAVPMGWLADRYRRGPIIGISSVIFGMAVFMSGLALNAFAFFVARFVTGIAKSNAGPVQGSLLADTYPIAVRGRLGAAMRCDVMRVLRVRGMAPAGKGSGPGHDTSDAREEEVSHRSEMSERTAKPCGASSW
jgi:hypothetical protein